MTLPPRSAWRRLEREPAARSAFSFLGRAYFSEWSLLSTFPGFLPLFRSFYSLCSLSCSFFFLKGIQRLMLCGFRSQIRGLTLQETRCAIRGPDGLRPKREMRKWWQSHAGENLGVRP